MESLTLEEYSRMRESGIPTLDCRPTLPYSEKHVLGSIGISINGSFEYMVNCFFPNKGKLLLISQKERLSESLLRLENEDFKSISYFNIDLWFEADLACSQISRVDASEASKYLEKMIDVSNSEDWDVLHVKGVPNVPLVKLIELPEEIESGSVLYCGNGHKSMAAASFLLSKNIITTDITGGL
ncbi:uncharacterized protein METZ01_LOCUS481216, partial [marine metagenome]